ncbi:hypothetical protein FRC00_006930 [Tulasnella sp. 408]|nr:hypothetical protein FRC00_006930 [Tulasnella sp. 408]
MATAPDLNDKYLCLASMAVRLSTLDTAHYAAHSASATGPGISAPFDPGRIPPDSSLTGHAFRHGDIEDSLKPWIASRPKETSGWNFKDGDVDQIYFGNWLRDYSQVIDTGSLKVFDEGTLVTLVKTLAYLQFGSSSGPFEVNSERLGVYLPVEHVDNPRDYADGQDARTSDPRLRPPVNPEELLIDPNTGMKNYIINEAGGWDTSAGFIRRQLQAAATQGRAAIAANSDMVKSDAYRLLGSALHPLEDFLAHSNFIELTLIRLGYNDVFPFVGNQTRIPSPTGKDVFPMVTGTSGSIDTIISFLGGIADYLSERSVPALKAKVQKAMQKPSLRQKFGKQNIGKLTTIQGLVSGLAAQAKHDAVASSGSGPSSAMLSKRQRREMLGATRRYDDLHVALQRDLGVVTAILKAAGLDINGDGNVDEVDLSKALSKVITLKDEVKAKIVDGLGDTVERAKGILEDLEDNLDVFISQNLQNLLTSLVSLINEKIGELRNTIIINTDTQWEVFNTTTSTDPTHSLLSKDHFQSILNEPAGVIAQMVTLNTVDKLVRVWENPTADVNAAIDEILQSIFHPDFPRPEGSDIQTKMTGAVETWLNTMTPQDRTETLRRLTKDSVSNLGNVRL